MVLFLILLPVLLSPLSWMWRSSPGFTSCLLGMAAAPAILAGAGLLSLDSAHYPGLILGAEFRWEEWQLAFLLFSALLWGIAGAFAGSYLVADERKGMFRFLYLLAMGGNFGLILTADVATFYCFYVLMTFAAYGLIIYHETPEAWRAGRIYLVMAIFGEIFVVAALYAAVHEANSWQLEEVRLALAESPHAAWITGLALVGFGVKAGAVPLYFWLPLAHPVAPTPASAILSGAMIKAGLLGWMHFATAGAGGSEILISHALIAIGLLAASGAVMVGLLQDEMKSTLAYSSISQMGWMMVMVGIILAEPMHQEALQDGLTLYAWNHGLAKGALFLGVGVAMVGTHRRAWVLAGLLLPALSLAGAPFTGGAMAKTAMKQTTHFAPGAWQEWLPWLIPLISVGTTLLLGRFLWLAWCNEEKQKNSSLAAASVPWIPLLVLVVFGTGWANRHFQLGVASPDPSWGGLWESLWPVILGATVLFGLLLSGRHNTRFPSLPPGDIVVLLERGWIHLQRRLVLSGLLDSHRWAINFVTLSDYLLRSESARGFADSAEFRIRRWNTVGVLFLLIVLGFIILA